MLQREILCVCLSVRVSVCLSVCSNYSVTDRGTNIKLGTIDHHPVLSVISSVNAFADFDMDIMAFASLFRFIRFTKGFLFQTVTTFIHSFTLVT